MISCFFLLFLKFIYIVRMVFFAQHFCFLVKSPSLYTKHTLVKVMFCFRDFLVSEMKGHFLQWICGNLRFFSSVRKVQVMKEHSSPSKPQYQYIVKDISLTKARCLYSGCFGSLLYFAEMGSVQVLL